MDGETYNAQFNDKHQLVVEKDGDATTYTFAFSYMRYGKVSENPEETIGIALSYTGADGNDKPNLAKLLTDWHEEYGYEEWLYNGSFTKK